MTIGFRARCRALCVAFAGIEACANQKQQPATASVREGRSPAAPANYDVHAQEIASTMGWFLLRQLHRVRVAFEGDFLLAIILGGGSLVNRYAWTRNSGGTVDAIAVQLVQFLPL